MQPSYQPADFETSWQQRWLQDRITSADVNEGGPTSFVLDMFPYPSGRSMHVGHPRGYVATDVYSRMRRMQGHRVLHPMGWDAFGLPAEETAIANKEYPALTVERNVARFKAQLQRLGLGYDWDREINTTDPKFYVHTQRLFLELFRRSLAYCPVSSVNWCPALGTVLANEDIVDGKSERGGHVVVQQPMRQWTLRITHYASRLLDDLELLPRWPEAVKNAQRQWIGRSSGHEFAFPTDAGVAITVFTTRIETLPGATFLALAPDAPVVASLLPHAANRREAEAYIEAGRARSQRERTMAKAKTGVVLGGVAGRNPATGATVPIMLADYVLASYGSGAIMGVPAHDERDREIAEVLALPVIECVAQDRLINAGPFTGFDIDTGRVRIADAIGAEARTNFKMRDWVFSRQRFWGEPFPIVWVEGEEAYRTLAAGPAGQWMPPEPVSYEADGATHFAVPVIPEHLDGVRLPFVESYEPTGEPSGPLAKIPEWVDAFIDPATGRLAASREEPSFIACRRETDTMPQWAGSSWYWLRYMDPANEAEPFSRTAAQTWGPVDIYAGADHAVAHLIYARFWHKVMFDCGLVPFPEPFERLEFLGYVLAADGSKISKRKGNSRNPDEIIAEVGADAFRLYEMAIGPFEKAAPWIDENLSGSRRFLDRLWRYVRAQLERGTARSSPEAALHLNRAAHKVTQDIEQFKFNTAVSALNILLNACETLDMSREDLGVFVRLLAPLAPHIAEELWAALGRPYSVHHAAWPEVDTALLAQATIALPVQVNGRRRGEVVVPSDAGEAAVRSAISEDAGLRPWLDGTRIARLVLVPGRIVNVVTEPA